MHDYRKLEVWRAARALVRVVYDLTATFPRSEQYGLTAQMRAAAVSVPSNIAEGSGRGSDRDNARFVGFAIGSSCELETLAILSHDLGYSDEPGCQTVLVRVADIRRMLCAFRRRLTRSEHA